LRVGSLSPPLSRPRLPSLARGYPIPGGAGESARHAPIAVDSVSRGPSSTLSVAAPQRVSRIAARLIIRPTLPQFFVAALLTLGRRRISRGFWPEAAPRTETVWSKPGRA